MIFNEIFYIFTEIENVLMVSHCEGGGVVEKMWGRKVDHVVINLTECFEEQMGRGRAREFLIKWPQCKTGF